MNNCFRLQLTGPKYVLSTQAQLLPTSFHHSWQTMPEIVKSSSSPDIADAEYLNIKAHCLSHSLITQQPVMTSETTLKQEPASYGTISVNNQVNRDGYKCCNTPCCMEAAQNRVGQFFSIRRQFLRNFLAEFLGTAILVIIGVGAIAQVVTSGGSKGDFFTINIAFAFGIAFGIYVSGSVSGGHINPAVTVVMAVLGKITWWMVPVYWIGQYMGAFFGAGIVHWVYHGAINHFAGGKLLVVGPNATADIFATYPAGTWVSSWDGFVDQTVGTAILVLAILAITDIRNLIVPAHFAPIVIGFAVGVIGMAFGFNAGFPVNPARDLGPRVYTAIAGWGPEVFSYRDYDWFWVPIIGPHVGALVGMAIYEILVGLHIPGRFILTRREDERVLVDGSN